MYPIDAIKVSETQTREDPARIASRKARECSARHEGTQLTSRGRLECRSSTPAPARCITELRTRQVRSRVLRVFGVCGEELGLWFWVLVCDFLDSGVKSRFSNRRRFCGFSSSICGALPSSRELCRGFAGAEWASGGHFMALRGLLRGFAWLHLASTGFGGLWQALPSSRYLDIAFRQHKTPLLTPHRTRSRGLLRNLRGRKARARW